MVSAFHPGPQALPSVDEWRGTDSSAKVLTLTLEEREGSYTYLNRCKIPSTRKE